MYFGKYEGRPVQEIPDEYLFWLLNKCSRTANPELLDAVRLHLFGPFPPGPRLHTSLDNIKRMLQRWYDDMFQTYLSGRNSSPEALRTLEEAYIRLLQLFEEMYGLG